MASASTRLVPFLAVGAMLSSMALLVNELAGNSFAAAPATPFTISGSLDIPLHPGAGGPLDLTLTNSNGQAMEVTGLSAEVTEVRQVEPGPVPPCDIADFAVDPFRGVFPIEIPASATKSLGDLGIPRSAMPVLRMLDTAVNQDGCKNAMLTLAYSGTAEESR